MAISIFLLHEAYIAIISLKSTSTAEHTYPLRPCILKHSLINSHNTLNLLSTESNLENPWNHFLTLSLHAIVTQYLSERSLRFKLTTSKRSEPSQPKNNC
jgi:hypothetical protein